MLWHGACDHPSDPATVWVTATPPPEVMTVSDTHEPEARVGMAGTTTPYAGIAAAVFAVAPESDVAVMSAVTDFEVVLVRTRKPGDSAARHRLARAVPGGRLRIRRADQRERNQRGGGGRRCAPHTHADADAGDDEDDERGHVPPAFAAHVGRALQRHRLGEGRRLEDHGERQCGGCPLPVGPADERKGEQHPGGQLQEDH